MKNEIIIDNENDLKEKIHTVRGVQVMLDSDLAKLYGVETKVLNQAVKRNIERFPKDFMFQLTDDEANSSRSQIVTLNTNGNLRGSNIKYKPYAFTEQGVAMLSSVLRSKTAIEVNIQIMRAFVSMRHFLQSNERVFVEIESIKKHLIDSDSHHKESDKRIDELFDLMDKYRIEEKQGIFFQGQIFDAYAKFESFIQSAKKEIVLIDGYVDLSVLERLAKKKKGVVVQIFTDSSTKLTTLDVQKFNSQYPTLTLNFTSKMHDRFLIIDNCVLYHVGASLKDLAKKCFAFEVLDSSLIEPILNNL